MSGADIIWAIGIGIVLIFGFVVLFGAPYLPTLSARAEDALDLLDLKPGQTMLELGSGDGKVLRAAAKRGINAVGYELNPILVVFSIVRNWRYRSLIKVKWGNFFRGRLPECDGVYVFLLTPFLAKLDKKLVQELSKPVKLVSFAYKIPGRRITKATNAQFLYLYDQ